MACTGLFGERPSTTTTRKKKKEKKRQASPNLSVVFLGFFVCFSGGVHAVHFSHVSLQRAGEHTYLYAHVCVCMCICVWVYVSMCTYASMCEYVC